MIQRFILASASVIALSAAANAADMYVPGPAGGGYKDGFVAGPLWNGPYVGINGGYASWGGDSSLMVSTAVPTTFAPEGWLGGGQIGYNWQGMWHPYLVLGIEADIEGANITGSTTAGGYTAESDLTWFGTVRGRVGFAVGAALIYGTGGFAYGDVQDKLVGGGKTVEHNATAGYAAGGGIEYAINPAWSGKAEYQYINLDSVSPTVTTKFDNEYNTVRLGLNYHILPGYAPLK
jgi:outer membrane immunogenic protein